LAKTEKGKIVSTTGNRRKRQAKHHKGV